jgi:acetyl esterase/lipase
MWRYNSNMVSDLTARVSSLISVGHQTLLTKTLFIVLVWLLASAITYSQPLIPSFSDVDYVGNSHVNQKMDIYIPPGLSSAAPVIVFIHGGGWLRGSKGPENIPFFQKSYENGFICADINYRLSTDSVWPAQIEDCKTAIRFLKANAITYNIDICRIGVIGESAGGYLAAMLGTTAGIKAFEGLHQGSSGHNSSVQAVVDISGPVDFLKEDGYYPLSCGTNGYYHEYLSYETQLLGIDYLHNHQELVKSANPVTYLSSDDARFFLIHGAGDCTVPPNQSMLLDVALSAAGIPADTLIIAAGQDHSSPYFKDLTRTALYNNFFLKHLSTPCPPIGIRETIFRNVTVFPNPAHDEINIDIPIPGSYTVEIRNIYGKTVLKVENKSVINISAFTGGVYFLKLVFLNETFTQKIIKL